MLNFLTENEIKDVAGLDERFSSMIDAKFDILDKLKSMINDHPP